MKSTLKNWFIHGVLSSALLLSLSTIPGSARLSAQTNQRTVIKLALLVSRYDQVARDHTTWARQLSAATNGRIELRVYYGGVAGSDAVVLEKMRLGQIDAAVMDIGGLRHFMRQALVMMAPYTFENFRQLDAAYKELGPSFEQEAYRNGFELITWFDAGQIRAFSKEPIRTFNDLKRARPWLYRESPFLFDFYRTIQTSGIPLDVSEIYMGLQTGTVDLVWSSPMLAMLFRWHNHLKYMSSTTFGFVITAFVLRRPVWDALSETDKIAFAKPGREIWGRYQRTMREYDQRVLQALQRRGMQTVQFAEQGKARAIGKRLRAKMVGRLYTNSLLQIVDQICTRYANHP
jgi:TRAP-type C4-dicarboxylate transport system substrate-binding protein